MDRKQLQITPSIECDNRQSQNEAEEDETEEIVLDMRVITAAKRDDVIVGDDDRGHLKVSSNHLKREKGRRKQERPVRFRFVDELSFLECDIPERFYEEIRLCEDDVISRGHDGKNWKTEEEEEEELEGKRGGKAEEKEEELFLSEKQFICHECGQIEVCQTDLDQHLRTTHAAEKAESYPTKYHRLGNELRLQATPSFQFGRHLLTTAGNYDKHLSTKKDGERKGDHDDTQQQQQQPTDDKHHHLFEREGISNKNCAKLHHHHRHFCKSPGQPDPSIPPSAQDLISPQNAPPTKCYPSENAIPRDNTPTSSSPQIKSASATNFLFSVASFPPACKDGTTNGTARGGGGVGIGLGLGAGLGSSTSSMTDTEDYCNRCQKHFCNKYYLRKHKQDVHGVGSNQSNSNSQQMQSIGGLMDQVTTDNGLSSAATSSSLLDVSTSVNQRLSTAPSMLPFSPIITSLPFVLPFPTGPGTNPILLQQPPITSSSPSFLGTSVLPGFPSLPSLMFLNPFASPLAILKAPSFLQAADINFASSSLNTLAELQNIENSVIENHSSSKTNINLLSATNCFGLDQTAHCELCRKEFCNTYFLKIHKREKHGIPLDDVDSQQLTAASAATAAAKRQAAVATLGLLDSVRFTGSNETEPGESLILNPNIMSIKLHDDSFASSANQSELHVRSEDTLCRLCKKQLSNRYGLMMHLLTAHSIKPEGFGLASELLQLDTLNKTMASNSDASKVSDRVACDICNKEVCNKYFLKTHKIKVHGLETNSQLDNFRENLNEPMFHDLRPLLQLGQTSQKHEEIAKTFLSIAEMGLKNAVNEMKREKLSTIEKDQIKSQMGKLNLKTSGRKDTQEDLSTAMNLIAQNSYKMASQVQLPGCKDTKPKGSNNQAPLALVHGTGVDIFKQGAYGKLSSHDKTRRTWSGGSKHSSKEVKPSGPIKSSEDNLKKSGIDPEAYCEICKKEFCSKYFLKTHKHKTHGVKAESGLENKAPPSVQMQSGLAVTQPSAGCQPSSEPVVSDLRVATEGSSSSSSETAAQKNSRETSSSNGARVTCEVCSKVLCNKYFLKTHMLKIHGSNPDSTRTAVSSGQGKPDTDRDEGLQSSFCETTQPSSSTSSSSNDPPQNDSLLSTDIRTESNSSPIKSEENTVKDLGEEEEEGEEGLLTRKSNEKESDMTPESKGEELDRKQVELNEGSKNDVCPNIGCSSSVSYANICSTKDDETNCKLSMTSTDDLPPKLVREELNPCPARDGGSPKMEILKRHRAFINEDEDGNNDGKSFKMHEEAEEKKERTDASISNDWSRSEQSEMCSGDNYYSNEDSVNLRSARNMHQRADVKVKEKRRSGRKRNRRSSGARTTEDVNGGTFEDETFDSIVDRKRSKDDNSTPVGTASDSRKEGETRATEAEKTEKNIKTLKLRLTTDVVDEESPHPETTVGSNSVLLSVSSLVSDAATAAAAGAEISSSASFAPCIAYMPLQQIIEPVTLTFTATSLE